MRMAGASLAGAIALLVCGAALAASLQPVKPTDTTPPDRGSVDAAFCDDFSGVKPHTGDAVDKAAGAMGADASAAGSRVAIGDKAAECQQQSHEAAHTVQQRDGKEAPSK